MSSIRQRLLGLIPALDYGLERLLSLMAVVETREISTAAISVGGSPRLLLNPDFVTEQCPDDASLFTLVLHELHHLLLGHTRLHPRTDRGGAGIDHAANIAFDATINALLSRRNPSEAGTRLFRRTYRSDRIPELLLRPPEGFPRVGRVPDDVPEPWRQLLDDLYYSGTGTFQETCDAVRAELKALPNEVLLLGSHPAGSEGPSGGDSEFLAVVFQVAASWPRARDARVRRTLEGVTRTEALRLPLPRSAPRRVLSRALLAAARAGGARSRSGTGPSAMQQVFPSRDRRAFALAAAGHRPLLWTAPLQASRPVEGPRPVDVYLDVSGSCRRWLPDLLVAIHCCRSRIAPRVFQFSTRVAELSLGDIARGRISTTGGTRGTVFARHLRKRRSRSAVVITDGFVGPLSSSDAEACRSANLQVVLLPGGRRDELASAACGFHRIDPECQN